MNYEDKLASLRSLIAQRDAIDEQINTLIGGGGGAYRREARGRKRYRPQVQARETQRS